VDRERHGRGPLVTAKIFLALALAACGCAAGGGSITISLAPVRVDSPSSIRRTALAAIDGRAEVFVSVTSAGPPPRTVVSSRPVKDGTTAWTQRISLAQLLPPAPAWDVEASPGSVPRVIIERAGGALNQLSLIGPGGEVGLTRLPLGSYGEPRFARRVPESPRRVLTAVLDGERLATFEVAPSGACGPVKVIRNAVSGVAVRRRGGYALFFKERRPGPVRGESTSPGVLRQIDLGPDFEPTGPVLSPLGETVVYEVDADAAGDGLAIVATVPQGLLVMIGKTIQGTWRTTAQQLIPRSEPLFGPSLLATSDGLRVAAVEIGAGGQAQLLLGRTAR